MRKKRVGFVTASPLLKTGFSTNASAILPILYKSDKYEIFLLNQAIEDKHPALKRMPWTSWGAITDELQNQEAFHKDEPFQRAVSYGNFRVEDFAIKNKLDVLFHVEDPWSSLPEFYYKKDWYQHIRKNFVNWVTADSLPILNMIKEWAQNCDNYWFWSSFAERALKEEDAETYKNIKTVHGAVNCENFKILPKEEKFSLRRKFGISDDTFLFLHLGRNQLRKLFFANIEALAKFKKQNPDKKAKLLIYCSWAERNGWPIAETVKEYGLDPSDVLAAYYCARCGAWEIKPYAGEQLNCNQCKTEKCCFTPGVESNISQQDLSKIYGICDAASSVFTSGGLEYFNIESLLCGLPLACTPYSCGEDFVKNPFVYSIEGSYTREQQTNFKKFVPNTNSIVNFLTKIHNMPQEKRDKIAKEGREWIINTFSPPVIAKQVEDFIDKCDLIDWDEYEAKKKDYEVKVPDAEVDINIKDDVEWLQQIYKNVMKMDVSPSDEGLNSWLNDLKQGRTRQEVEGNIRNIAAQHNEGSEKKEFKTFLDLKRKNKRGLFIIKESGGDILICSALFKDFHKRYPKHDLYVMCDPKFQEILVGNPYVHKILPFFPPAENELLSIGAGLIKGQELFHVYLNPAIGSQKIVNYLSNSNPRELK